MKIQLIKDSEIKFKNKIYHNNEFSIVETYLQENKEYDPDFTGYPEITAKSIKQLTFSSTFIDGDSNFNLLDIDKYDSAVVKDYPYLPNKSFWIIKTKSLDSNRNWKFTFQIDLVTTFGTGKLSKTKDIRIARKHINYLEQFDNYSERELKADSILRQQQPSPDFELKSKKVKNVFYNERENRISDYAGNGNYWIMYTLSRDYFTNNQYNAISMDPDNPAAWIAQPDLEIYAPLTNDIIVFADPDGDTNDNPSGFFNDIAIDEPKLLLTRILDFLPSTFIDSDGTKIYNTDPNAKLNLATSSGGTWGYSNEFINKENVLSTYKLNQDLFNFDYQDSFFSGDDKWDYKQVLEIEFEPFKKYELIFGNESEYSSQTFSNADLSKLPVKDSEFIKKGFGYAANGYTILSEIINKINGNEYLKVDRDLETGLLTDAWKEKNQQKAIRIAQDFALPASAAIAGGLLGGAKGAAAGLAIGTANTILRNQKIKNTPDVLTGAATGFKQEAILGFSTRDIYIHEPDERSKKSIALEFHKFGLYHFEYSDTYTDDQLLPKIRFNYLELSQLCNIDIIDNLDETYSQSYLDQFKNGITFWNYTEQLKTMLFSYNYKNPDKEGILEKINSYSIPLQIGYTTTISIDNSSGKYDNGLTLTASISENETQLRSQEFITANLVWTTLNIYENRDTTLAERIYMRTWGDQEKYFIEFTASNTNNLAFITGNFSPDDITTESIPASRKTVKAAKKSAKKEPKKIELSPEQKKALYERTHLPRDREVKND